MQKASHTVVHKVSPAPVLCKSDNCWSSCSLLPHKCLFFLFFFFNYPSSSSDQMEWDLLNFSCKLMKLARLMLNLKIVCVWFGAELFLDSGLLGCDATLLGEWLCVLEGTSCIYKGKVVKEDCLALAYGGHMFPWCQESHTKHCCSIASQKNCKLSITAVKGC